MTSNLPPPNPPTPQPEPFAQAMNRSRLREAEMWDEMAQAFERIIAERSFRGQNATVVKLAPYVRLSRDNAAALRAYVQRGAK